MIKKLEDFYKKYRDHYSDDFRLRIQRSLSWIKQAYNTEEQDVKFILLWISFNAAYANEFSETLGDKNTFLNFLKKICQFDVEHKLHSILADAHKSSFDKLIDTPYTFQPFWDCHNGKRKNFDWKVEFNETRYNAIISLRKKKTHVVLQIVFGHLYTLRNQIVHGGATFNSQVNRTQINECITLLSSLIVVMLDIMMKNNDEMDWGKPFYPVVK